MKAPINSDRRQFLKTTAFVGGGLTLSCYLPGAARRLLGDDAKAAETFTPNAWLRITPDNAVTIVVAKSEMGQGVMTSMPMLVAEELDADWTAIKLEQAPAAPAYINPFLGSEATGGSTSVRSSYEPLRQAGAAARAMLVRAAAQRWGVSADGLRTENGT